LEFLPLALQDPATVWGLFQRALGFIFLIAIGQLYHQVVPIAGRQGHTPVHLKLAEISQDYPGWRKYLFFPTLLWLHAGDRFLKALVVAGSLAALVVISGGPYAGYALFACWLIYLSFDLAVGLSYPWDSVLFEAGFLGLFLPALPVLPEVAALSLPHPAVAWLYRLLLFRLILGFGKFKFWKANPRDTGYFRAFMVNIPLPSYPAWFLYRLPAWFFQLVVAYSFVVEVIAPFFIFFSGLRLVAAVSIAALMLGIWLVSNFGFFNLLTIILCLPLLDAQSAISDLRLTDLYATPRDFLTSAAMLFLLVGGILHFPFNSWCTFTWLHWPSALHLRPGLVAALLGVYRALIRFRLVHAYGVFSKDSTPPMRLIPVIEGSRDGVHWEAYEYRYFTTTERTPPRFVAPYHPRFDHAIFYDSFGINDANFLWSVMGAGNPYEFKHASALEAVLQRLLEGNPGTNKFFRRVPFDPARPPLQVRVNLYRFQPTSFREWRQTGRWWTRHFAATHFPARSLNPGFWQLRSGHAELFHWDAVYWRRWSPRMQKLHATGLGAVPAQVYAAAAAGLAFDTRYFWEECLPAWEPEKRSWHHLPALASASREKYSPAQWRDLERLWCRLTIMLGARLEPYFLGRQTPQIPLKSYFHFGLFLHHIIGKGRAAYEFALQKPQEAQLFMADFNLEKGFYFYGIFWCETLVFQARKFRWGRKVGSTKADDTLPGFVQLIDFVSEQFSHIGEENWPSMHRSQIDGEWVIQEQATYAITPADEVYA
jgi:Lipase maturation factor